MLICTDVLYVGRLHDGIANRPSWYSVQRYQTMSAILGVHDERNKDLRDNRRDSILLHL